jgi:hypothetical protein
MRCPVPPIPIASNEIDTAYITVVGAVIVSDCGMVVLIACKDA